MSRWDCSGFFLRAAWIQVKLDTAMPRCADQLGRPVTAAQPARPTPINWYRSLGKCDADIQPIANEVWILRSDRANRSCSQAAAFSY